MNVILSRKGFDSSSGGCPSPILPDGRLLSLPIPESESQPQAATDYSRLRVDGHRSYAEIMAELGITIPRSGAHLDPDLRAGTLDERASGWRGLFGQAGSSQRHLEKQGVGPGDLFLFFGLFRPTEEVAGWLRWIRGERSRHVIWGYLQVDEVLSISPRSPTALQPWMGDHPHVAGPDRRFNALYVAAASLSFAPWLPGFGVFSFHEDLCLTVPTGPVSSWRLPAAFHPDYCASPLSYHARPDRWSAQADWQPDRDTVRLRSTGRGQEFVVEANEGIASWAAGLIADHAEFRFGSDTHRSSLSVDGEGQPQRG